MHSFYEVQGDITTFTGGAIVNPANDRLWEGSGCCGAIFQAVLRLGGAQCHRALTEACRAIGHCPTGKAVITPSCGLPAPFIIHAVGPIWPKSSRSNLQPGQALSAEEAHLAAQLGSAYAEIIRLCVENNISSVAIPSISTGHFGFPQELAAAIARTTCDKVCAELNANLEVTFYAYDEPAFHVLSAAPSAAALGWISTIQE
jgi:O-acetyl-ADP-ribose deacetylase (regulator of RNase III)